MTIFDSRCKGLMLEIRSSGGKTYYFKYRDKRGSTRQIKIADCNDLSLSQARSLTDKRRAKVAMGEDPLEAQRQYKSIMTFRTYSEELYLPYVKSYKRSWKSDECYLRRQILPVLGSKYLDDISKLDIIELINSLQEKAYKPGTCNRSLVLIRYAFNLAIRWKTPGVTANPTNDVPLLDDFEGMRNRFLSREETQRLFEAVNQSDTEMLKYIVRMLVLTGARKREVLDAKWEDFDINRRQWKILITKSGRPRHVPLSNSVITLLADLPRKNNSPWVFPNPNTGNPYREIFKSWDTARRKAGLPEVRMHDLRHSFASFLVNAGRSLYEVQKILGHSQIKTTQRYAHLSQDTLLDAVDTVGCIVGRG